MVGGKIIVEIYSGMAKPGTWINKPCTQFSSQDNYLCKQIANLIFFFCNVCEGNLKQKLLDI